MLVIGQLKMKNYWGLRVGLNKRKKQTNKLPWYFDFSFIGKPDTQKCGDFK